jgi:excinuclease UvrABC helicase subunit UvrB
LEDGIFDHGIKAAASRLEFEEAAQLSDRVKELRAQQIYKT